MGSIKVIRNLLCKFITERMGVEPINPVRDGGLGIRRLAHSSAVRNYS
jgi:hypothetical protein